MKPASREDTIDFCAAVVRGAFGAQHRAKMLRELTAGDQGAEASVLAAADGDDSEALVACVAASGGKFPDVDERCIELLRYAQEHPVEFFAVVAQGLEEDEP